MPLRQLSGLVSFVTQDNYLFRCSLLENIRLGDPSATDEQVRVAARAAQCEEFITKLPQGYDTPAGEAGKRLFGGEKQRVAIARMLLKNAPIVILDEATASIDPENEHLIQSGLSELTRGKTSSQLPTGWPPLKMPTKSLWWTMDALWSGAPTLSSSGSRAATSSSCTSGKRPKAGRSAHRPRNELRQK